MPVLAAVLAILGYSVNESVVIFDRVREIARNSRGMDDSEEIVNTAISQTWGENHYHPRLHPVGGISHAVFWRRSTVFICFGAYDWYIFSIYSSVLIAGPTACVGHDARGLYSKR